jgi:hypothetical protein
MLNKTSNIILNNIWQLSIIFNLSSNYSKIIALSKKNKTIKGYL